VRRALALTALLLAGCGGNHPGGDRATYDRDGRAICADYRAAIARLGQPTAVGELGPYTAKALPVLTRTVRRLERLDPPADLADEYAAFRDAARQTVERAGALRDAAAKADAPEVQRLLREAAQASPRRAALAKAAGLQDCAQV
jgi:hypothetical protein